ncbi:hypothetical protein [Hutsoniella sourekii]|uniref:hypothetical protein n=1 Tax=Hutsoniella sourekii TaxID=87650 RepID=UPI000488950C|nr:hypothetical protein [Hutsoniella sourekii]
MNKIPLEDYHHPSSFNEVIGNVAVKPRSNTPTSKNVKHNSFNANRASQQKWTWRHSGLVMFFAVLILALIAGIFAQQMQNHEIDQASQHYREEARHLNTQSDNLLYEISQAYNYQTVIEAAKREGMSVNPNQVKDVNP